MRPAADAAATLQGSDDVDDDDDDTDDDDADEDAQANDDDDVDVVELQFQEPQHNAKCQQQAERRGKLSAKGNRSNTVTTIWKSECRATRPL